VEVVRRFRRHAADSLLVMVRGSGLQLAVPSWMLDAIFCGRLVDEPEARLAVSALTELRELLDSQGPLASCPRTEQEQRRVPKRRR
jgi:hypothetical protein